MLRASAAPQQPVPRGRRRLSLDSSLGCRPCDSPAFPLSCKKRSRQSTSPTAVRLNVSVSPQLIHTSGMCRNGRIRSLQAHALHLFGRLLPLACVFVSQIAYGHFLVTLGAHHAVLQHLSIRSHLPRSRWLHGCVFLYRCPSTSHPSSRQLSVRSFGRVVLLYPLLCHLFDCCLSVSFERFGSSVHCERTCDPCDPRVVFLHMYQVVAVVVRVA